MAAHRLIRAGIAAALLTGGCRNQPIGQDASPSRAPLQPARQIDSSPPSHPSPGHPNVDQMDADLGTVDVLARKTADYTQNLEQLLAKRQAAAPPAPSEVQWSETSSAPIEAIGSNEPAVAAPPSVRPAPRSAGNASPNPAFIAPAAQAPAAVASATAAPDMATASLRPNAPTQITHADNATAHPSTEQSSFDEIQRKIERRMRDYPQDVDAHLDYQLMQYLLDQPVPHLASMATLPGEDRELLTAMMDGLSNFRNAVRADGNMLLSRKVRPMLHMADRLRSQADLSIPTIALCTRVDGFGVYEPIDPARFAAGREHTVIVYTEVENFASQMNEARMWETKLSQETTLYTESGMPVAMEKPRVLVDLSRNRRHDFFVVKMMKLPATLPIGRYLLKVTIVDQTVNRVSETTLPIVIVAG